MAARVVTVSVENAGRTQSTTSGLSPEAVARLLREWRGSRDVTVSISDDANHETVRVAIDDSKGFVGCESPLGVFQFVPSRAERGATSYRFIIGRQETDLEARYVSDFDVVVQVVQEWLEGSPSTVGTWERQ
jgi:hypothetical protein